MYQSIFAIALLLQTSETITVTVDLFASRGNVYVYVAVENATNARIEAGATPVTTLGQPRAFRVGVRWAGR